ncbi:MAG: methyltransferase domain-containing protein [Sphingobacteriales bacterium]|nr:MAG: methyltransferase domain-containing protein [Sphingobacteriales bacterium]
MNNQLTDNNFWKNFWESKKNLIVKINPNYTFAPLLSDIIKQRGIKSVIELGGFPGYYSVFLKKYFALKATLFDYFIHPQIIEDVLVFNNLAITDIDIIEADLFKYKPLKKYDLVSSFGLIEHFLDTKNIIAKHLEFLNQNGTLFITLPNFKGVNGWVQKSFDPENYNKHYIDCMDLDLLSATAKELGLKNVQTFYYGGFSTWLENKSEKPKWVQNMVKAIWLFGKILTRIIRVENKFLSPYIVLIAN